MAAQQPLGKPRRFWGFIGLTLITFGIYGLVYHYKVFGELDRQHGRKHHQLMFWLGLIPYVGVVFNIIYVAKEIPQMQGYRQMRGMGPGITRTSYFVWTYLGLLILVGPFIALYKLNKSARELWFAIYRECGVPLA